MLDCPLRNTQKPWYSSRGAERSHRDIAIAASASRTHLQTSGRSGARAPLAAACVLSVRRLPDLVPKLSGMGDHLAKGVARLMRCTVGQLANVRSRPLWRGNSVRVLPDFPRGIINFGARLSAAAT